MTAQPYRGKLTPAKWRVLLCMRRGAITTLPNARPQTIRALIRFGLIQQAAPGWYDLTPTGTTAAERYVPRRRVP